MSATEDDDRVKIIVRLNGTSTNPYHRYGLKQNPFPQLGKAEYYGAEMAINSLDGDPITSVDDIVKRLEGFPREFVDLCVGLYKPGERVAFMVTWPKGPHGGI